MQREPLHEQRGQETDTTDADEDKPQDAQTSRKCIVYILLERCREVWYLRDERVRDRGALWEVF